MKFESHWPKGSGGVSFFKQIVDDARQTTDDAKNFVWGFGGWVGGRGAEVYFFYYNRNLK